MIPSFSLVTLKLLISPSLRSVTYHLQDLLPISIIFILGVLGALGGFLSGVEASEFADRKLVRMRTSAMERQTDLFTIAAYLMLLGAIVAGFIFFRAARKRGSSAVLSFVGAWIFSSGLLMAALVSLHLVTIIGRALLGKGVGGEADFTYNFRFYSLMLLGFVVGTASGVCILHARSIAGGKKDSGKTVLLIHLFLLVIFLPMVPIQPGFATGFSAFSLVAAASLWLSRSRLN